MGVGYEFDFQLEWKSFVRLGKKILPFRSINSSQLNSCSKSEIKFITLQCQWYFQKLHFCLLPIDSQ